MASILDVMTSDHARLDALLAESARGTAIESGPYKLFRRGLLRHIALEEKILLIETRRRRGGDALPIAQQLKLDHSAIAALLVPTPDADIVRALRDLLAEHNSLEEGPTGLYATCDRLLAADVRSVLDRLSTYPTVPAAAHFDGARARAQIRNLLSAAWDARGKAPPHVPPPLPVAPEPEKG